MLLLTTLLFAIDTNFQNEAHADVITNLAGAKVHWTRGLVLARGAAAADLHAPRIDVARVKALRQAKERARKILKTAANKLGAKKLAPTVEQEIVLDSQFSSDGSTAIWLGIPIEILRPLSNLDNQESGKNGVATSPATSLIIDARKTKAAPSLRLVVQSAKARSTSNIVYHNSRSELNEDKRAGNAPLNVAATSFRRGRLSLPAKPEIQTALRGGVPIFILLGEKL